MDSTAYKCHVSGKIFLCIITINLLVLWNNYGIFSELPLSISIKRQETSINKIWFQTREIDSFDWFITSHLSYQNALNLYCLSLVGFRNWCFFVSTGFGVKKLLVQWRQFHLKWGGGQSHFRGDWGPGGMPAWEIFFRKTPKCCFFRSVEVTCCILAKKWGRGICSPCPQNWRHCCIRHRLLQRFKFEGTSSSNRSRFSANRQTRGVWGHGMRPREFF